MSSERMSSKAKLFAATTFKTVGLSKAARVSMLALGLLGLGAGVVAAQEATPESEAAPAAADASIAGMVAKGKSVLAALDASSQNVSRMLRDARAAKDVVKALCLDDKLSQVDVAKRSAADRVESLEAAAAAGNLERAQHDFAVIGALEERANALSAEANQCIGEEKGYVGGSSLKVTFDPTIPQSDTSAPPAFVVVVQPPQAASPTF